VKALEWVGIRAYMPVIDDTWGKRTLLRKDEFTYDAERDVYVSPAGESLPNTGARKKLGLTRYVADPHVCISCLFEERMHRGQERARSTLRNVSTSYFSAAV
jgi:hypothetical protein